MNYVLNGKNLNIMIGEFGLGIAEIYLWAGNPNKPIPTSDIAISQLEESIVGEPFKLLRYEECKEIYVDNKLVWNGKQQYIGHGDVKIHLATSKARVRFLTRGLLEKE